MVAKGALKHLIKLAGDPAYRRECKTIIASGHHCFKEFDGQPAGVWVTEKYLSRHPAPSTFERISQQHLQRITKEAEPEGILFSAAFPENFHETISERYDKTLALYRPTDPKNVGSLIRTGLALGWHQVVLFGKHTVDPYSLQSIRCSKGGVLKIPRIVLKKETPLLELNPFQILLAEAGNSSNIQTEKRIMLILGSESHGFQGLPQDIRSQGQPVSIQTDQGMPCLNVNAAGAILMHKLMYMK